MNTNTSTTLPKDQQECGSLFKPLMVTIVISLMILPLIAMYYVEKRAHDVLWIYNNNRMTIVKYNGNNNTIKGNQQRIPSHEWKILEKAKYPISFQFDFLHNPLCDQDVEQVSKYNVVEFITKRCDITDDCFSYLSKMNSLKNLTISDNDNISNNGITRLRQMQLETVSLYNIPNVSKEGIEILLINNTVKKLTLSHMSGITLKDIHGVHNDLQKQGVNTIIEFDRICINNNSYR